MDKDVIIGGLVGLVAALLLGKYNGETPTWLWIVVIIVWIPIIILWIYHIKEKLTKIKKNKKSE